MAGQLQQLCEVYAEISHSGIQCDCLRLHSKIFQLVPVPFNCPFKCSDLIEMEYISLIKNLASRLHKNDVGSHKNLVNFLPVVRFVARQQFICQALVIVA